jgi:hypothetical protein
MSNDPKAKSSSWTAKQQMLLDGQTVLIVPGVGTMQVLMICKQITVTCPTFAQQKWWSVSGSNR